MNKTANLFYATSINLLSLKSDKNNSYFLTNVEIFEQSNQVKSVINLCMN